MTSLRKIRKWAKSAARRARESRKRGGQFAYYVWSAIHKTVFKIMRSYL